MRQARTDRRSLRTRRMLMEAIAPLLLAAMITSMLITTIRSWIEGGLTQPAETIDRMFHTAANAVIHAGLQPLSG